MRVLAVPVKQLELAKRRLAPVLSPAERAALSLLMLEDVLDACRAQPGWETWVVSSSEPVLEVAARRGARPVPEERGPAVDPGAGSGPPLDAGAVPAGHGSLLRAIRQVEGRVRGKSSQLAVLLADLPLLDAPTLARALARPTAVIAAPAHSDGGTNLLVRRPPSAIAARFGRSSFAKHRAGAYRRGLTFDEVQAPELAFDLDRPDDLARLAALALVAGPRRGRTGGGRAMAACLEMDLAPRLEPLLGAEASAPAPLARR